jgi:hypothetical protein
VALADEVGASADDHVDDNEILYRCVKPVHWKRRENGEFYLSAQAFTDRNYRPSVDRAKLCSYDPSYTQREETDYICTLLTEDIRAIETVVKYHDSQPVEQHAIDVDPVPLHDNAAHAEIYAHPQISSRSVFRRLQESLVGLSWWEGGFTPPEAAG